MINVWPSFEKIKDVDSYIIILEENVMAIFDILITTHRKRHRK